MHAGGTSTDGFVAVDIEERVLSRQLGLQRSPSAGRWVNSHSSSTPPPHEMCLLGATQTAGRRFGDRRSGARLVRACKAYEIHPTLDLGFALRFTDVGKGQKISEALR